MDPQQRLILEVVYEALEDAGITLPSISGTNTSVFVGSFTNDYSQLVARDMETYPLYSVNGISNAILANRVSFFYNLRGPSVTLDTACSASLVGLHLGNESLLRGESDLCIVVGSALHLAPNTWQIMTDLGLLSEDGRCRAFDAKASGYVRGEGVCAIVMRRKSDAEMAADHVRAVIRATGTNHDGIKSAIGLPSAESQERLLRETYRKAGLNPDDTQFFEAHGTGTKAGDPREAKAIGSVFATPTRTKPLFLGSVKTNIGHLEGAAGLIGVIKATLALEKKTIPPNMLFEDPNPDISFHEWKITVPTCPYAWNVRSPGVRRASVNSFGYGGANAHVILDEYVQKEAITAKEEQHMGPMSLSSHSAHSDISSSQSRPYLLPLSTHSMETGAGAAQALGKWLQNSPETRLVDLAHTLTTRRTQQKMRSYVIGSSTREVGEILCKETVDKPAIPWTTLKLTRSPTKVAFIFTGQGAQSSQMGIQLLRLSPRFRASLERADAAMRQLTSGPAWSIVDELSVENNDNIHQSEYSQPICTALQLALVDLVSSWGVKPDAVCGHSSGEIAAAYAAGVLSFEAAMAVAYYRGVYMGQDREPSPRGGMLAVGLSQDDTEDYLRPYKGRLVIAAVNSPTNVTISGDYDAITKLAGDLVTDEVFHRRLQVPHAFHSHHMEPLAPAYLGALETCDAYQTSDALTCRFFSTVSGVELKNASDMGASYWAQNMVRPVRFAHALAALVSSEIGGDSEDYNVLLEFGPHPALRGPTRQVLKSMRKQMPHLATLSRGRPAFESLLDSMGQLHVRGYALDLVAVNQDYEIDKGASVATRDAPKVLCNLPPYTWNHNLRSWSVTRLVKEHLHNPARHTLLGRQVPGSVATAPRWRNFLRLSEISWLREHVFDRKPLFPGAGYMSMAIEAFLRFRTDITRDNVGTIRLQDINIKAPMILTDSEVGMETFVELRPLRVSSKTVSNEWFDFYVSAYTEDGVFTQNCTGMISLVAGTAGALDPAKPQPSQSDLIARSTRRVKSRTLYKQIADNGLFLGDRFALIKDCIYCGTEYVVAPSVVFDPEGYSPHELSEGMLLYPSILDSCFQTPFTGIETRLDHRMETVFVPTFVKSLTVSGLMEQQSITSPTKFGISTCVDMPNKRTALGNIHLRKNHVNGNSSLVLEVQGLEMTAMGNAAGKPGSRHLFFQQNWKPCFGSMTPSLAASHISSVNQALELCQFQYPGANVLLLPSGDDAENKNVLRCLERLDHLFGGFRSVSVLASERLHPQSVDMESSLKAISRCETINEAQGVYDLILSLWHETPLEDLDSFAGSPSTVVMNYESEAPCSDWTRLVALEPGGVFQIRRSPPPTPSPIQSILTISKSSLFSASATKLYGSLEQRGDNIDYALLSELSKHPAYDLHRNFVITIDAGSSLDNLVEKEWESLRHLLGRDGIKVIWLSQGATMDCSNPKQAMVQGLLRVARNENPTSQFVQVDIDDESSAALLTQVLHVLSEDIHEQEITIRKGIPYIPRVVEDVVLNAKLVNGVGGDQTTRRFDSHPALSLEIGTVGLLETLRFGPHEDMLSQALNDNEVEVRVMATSLNFRDIAATMGIVQDRRLGDECAGVVHRIGTAVDASSFKIGDRVVACRPGQGAHSTFIRQPAALCLKIPDSFSFTVAASFSGVLTTAYYALVMLARLQPGETVLIHSGSGGVGQMAIQLAQQIGARILTTCSEGKRNFLKNNFALSDNQIFSSRDDSFIKYVMRTTNGQGADVVLNSLAGNLLTASWSCIAPLGRFIEIGKRDIHQNSHLPMEPFRNNVMFASVDLVHIYESQPRLAQYILEESAKLFFSERIKPARPIVEYDFQDVEKAMRLMQQGRHMGKIVLVSRPESLVSVMPDKFTSCKKRLDAEKIYLIIGGLGGLGTVLAEWMVRSGAKKIAIFSRSGCGKLNARETVEWLLARDIKVRVFQGNVTSKSDVETCVLKLGPKLGGIFFAVMSLEDSLICNMTHERWQKGLAAKVKGILNVHEATCTADWAPELDFFISFSSSAAITGNKGQANYAAANAYVDALMQYRHGVGLSGFTINIGAVAGVGVVDKVEAISESLKRMKHDTITEHELLYQIQEAVDRSLSFKALSKLDPSGTHLVTQANSPCQIITGINISETGLFWAKQSHFRTLYANRQYSANSTNNQFHDTLAAALSAASSHKSRRLLFLNAFLDKASAVFSIPRDKMEADRSLSSYGLDSIVAVELNEWLHGAVPGANVSLFDLMNASSIGDVATKAIDGN